MTALKEKYVNPLTDFGFKKLSSFEAAEIARFSPEEREAYEDSLKYYRDLKNVVDTARDEGKEEGRVEGRVEGKVEGKEEGKEEGREERNMEIAKTMKAEGFSSEQITRLTGLSIEEIEKL